MICATHSCSVCSAVVPDAPAVYGPVWLLLSALAELRKHTAGVVPDVAMWERETPGAAAAARAWAGRNGGEYFAAERPRGHLYIVHAETFAVIATVYRGTP